MLHGVSWRKHMVEHVNYKPKEHMQVQYPHFLRYKISRTKIYKQGRLWHSRPKLTILVVNFKENWHTKTHYYPSNSTFSGPQVTFLFV